MQIYKWIPWVFLIGANVSCESTAACVNDTECFAGESCRDGMCAPASNSQNQTNQNTSSNGLPNNQSTNNQANNQVSNNSANSHSPDMGEDVAVDMEPMLACQVDPFTSTCTDDMWEPNNTWTAGKRLNGNVAGETPGCPIISAFNSFDLTIEPMFCARDASDWFFIDFFPCQDRDVRITWTMTVEPECRADLFSLDSLSFDCGTEANCQSTDEVATVTIVVPATGSRQSQLSYVEIKAESGVQFPYQLRVQVD